MEIHSRSSKSEEEASNQYLRRSADERKDKLLTRQEPPPNPLVDEISTTGPNGLNRTIRTNGNTLQEEKTNTSPDNCNASLDNSPGEIKAIHAYVSDLEGTADKDQKLSNIQAEVSSTSKSDEKVVKLPLNKPEEHKSNLLMSNTNVTKTPTIVKSDHLQQVAQSRSPHELIQLNILTGTEFVVVGDTIYYISDTNELYFCNKHDSSKRTFVSAHCIGTPVHNEKWIYYRNKSSELWRVELNQTLGELISDHCDGDPAFYAAEKSVYFRQNKKLVCLNLQTNVHSEIHDTCGEMPPVVQETSSDSNHHYVWFQGGVAYNELWRVHTKKADNKKKYDVNCGNARPIVHDNCIYWLAGNTKTELWWVHSHKPAKIGRSDVGPCGPPVLVGDHLYYKGSDSGLYKLKVFEKANTADRIADSFIGNPVSGNDSFVYYIGNDNVLRSLPTDTNLWLSNLNPKTCIFDINLPGSHNAIAYKDSILRGPWNCQIMGLRAQLAIGIRLFDIRLQVEVPDLQNPKFTFYACHGNVSLGIKMNRYATFYDVMEEFKNFLKTYPKEFLVVCLKIDDWGQFEKVVHKPQGGIAKKVECLNVLQKDFGHYFTYGKENQSGSHLLEDARGKIFLLNRLSAAFTRWGLFINMGGAGNRNQEIRTNLGFVWVQDTGGVGITDQSSKREAVMKTITSLKPGQMSLNFTSWTTGFKGIGQSDESLWLLDHLSREKNRPSKLGWFLSNYSGDRVKSKSSHRRKSFADIIISSNFEYADFQSHEEFPVKFYFSFNKIYSDVKNHLTSS